MKKHLIAVAVAAAVAAPAAMADTTLYGLAHVSVDYIDNDALADANVNVQSASSRLGVKGTEKLSNGLSALYQMEFGVDMSDSSSSTFSARNQFVGLTGGFGTLVAGRHDTPMKLAISKYDLFGDQIGDNGNATLYNFRAPNVVAYMLPSNLGGFNGSVAYVADHNGDFKNGDNSDNNDNQAYNVQLGYKHKIFTIDGVYQSWDSANETYTDWMIGAGVKFGGLKVNALYQKPDKDAVGDLDIYGLGAAYTFGNNTVKGQYYTASTDGDDATMWALGYDYKMSKQTTVYAAYGQGKDGFNVVGDGHGGKTGVSKVGGIDTYNGADVSAFSVGVKHSF
jgi:predicted porin